MKRLLTLLATAILCLTYATAANDAGDLVTLKNGDRITGTIVDYKTGESVRIRLDDGQELTIGYDRIKSIGIADSEEQPDEPYRRMVEHTGLSFAVGFEFCSQSYVGWKGMNLQAGWRPRKGLFMGMGIMPSSVRCDNKDYNHFLFGNCFFGMPIYAVCKQDFVHMKASPFLQARIGAMVIDSSWTNNDNEKSSSGGLYWHLSTGCRVAFKHAPVAFAPHMGVSFVYLDEFSDNYSCTTDYTKACFSMGATIEF